MTLRFKTVCDYGDGGYLAIAQKQNNGDFDWFPVIKVSSLHDYSDFKENWNVLLMAVSPQEAGQSGIDKAFACCGFDDFTLERIENDPVEQALALAEYGIFAPLWEQQGNNLRKLLKEAHKEAWGASFLTGFFFDRAVNALGATGWDALRGDLIPSSLYAESA